MKIFGQIVRTALNTALLPVAVVKDVVTLGGVLTGDNDDARAAETATGKALQRLKDEASEDEEQ